MPGFDKSNKNPSRLSRLPGAYRGEHKQELLCWRTGVESFEEWRRSIEVRLFEIENLLALVQEDPELPPVLVDGWLHKSSIGMLTGAMKTNKSWTLQDLAIALTTGTQWLGKQCRESTVLYFDAEINRRFWQKRFRMLCQGIGQDPIEVAETGRFRPVFLAGKGVTIRGLHGELVRMFERGELNGIDLIIIDPIYQLYETEWEENSNDHMAKLGKYIRELAELTEISVVFAHHHSKGSQEGKRHIEKASGGGSFGRFVASSLAITYAGDGNDGISQKFILGWTTSHFPPAKDQVAVRTGFVWQITDEDPKEAARSHRTVDQIMDCLPDDGLSSSLWLEACRERFQITDKAFETLRPMARKQDRCHFSQVDGKWKPTVSELEKRKAALTASEDDE